MSRAVFKQLTAVKLTSSRAEAALQKLRRPFHERLMAISTPHAVESCLAFHRSVPALSRIRE
jgi:hypothetical protein